MILANAANDFWLTPRFDSAAAQYLFYGLLVVSAIVLLVIGYQAGKLVVRGSSRRAITQKEQDLFATQRGLRDMYEAEMAKLRTENETLKADKAALETRVEDYRKKAAGYGGLFNSGGKRADAMYALLLENEALEETLLKQNEKLSTERTDVVKESVRAAGYRRVLMSQIMNDERIKEYVAEILADDRTLPKPVAVDRKALPHDE